MESSTIYSYVMDTFYSLFEGNSLPEISYGLESGDVQIHQCDLTFFSKNNPTPAQIIWKDWEDTSIPILFHDDDTLAIIEKKDGSVIINYDIVASAFYFLSLWQEYHIEDRDENGRFPYTSSIQCSLEIPLLPVVNYYFDILRSAIEQASFPLTNRYKSDHSMTTFVSHDIDSIYSGWIKDSFASLKRFRFGKIIGNVSRKLFDKDNWDNIDEILRLEEELDINSTFYFLAKKDPKNADYTIDDVAYNFHNIVKSGSEVGIHGSLGSGFNDKQLQEEMSLFQLDLSGNRFHFLQFDAKLSFKCIEDSGLHYDSSLGFAEHIGFRNGFCHPYQPFNFKENKAFRHIEIPLNLMDTTLRDSGYMGLDDDQVINEKIDRLIDEVKKFNGVISILWHNPYFTNQKFKGWRDRFIQLIKKLKEHNSRFLTGQQIAKIYRRNSTR